MQSRHATGLSKTPPFERQCPEGVLYLQRDPQDYFWSLCSASSCLFLCHTLIAYLGSQPHTAFHVHWPFPFPTEKADISMNLVSSFGEHGFSPLLPARLYDFSFTQTLAAASFPYPPRFAFFFTGGWQQSPCADTPSPSPAPSSWSPSSVPISFSRGPPQPLVRLIRSTINHLAQDHPKSTVAHSPLALNIF